MNNRTGRVLQGFIMLSEVERGAFTRELTRYLNANSWQKPQILDEMRKSIPTIDTGPVGAGCPCCGR